MTVADPPSGVRPAPALARRVLAGYSLGSLVTGSFGTVPGLLLLPYLTDTLGISAGAAGLVVLLPKAWDVLVNPVAGRFSDRRGDRRAYLIVAGVALALLFAALLAGPFHRGAPAGLYVAFVFLAAATAYAFFQVPYVAMPAELTAGYAERTRLMTWRVALLAVAILISGAVAPLVVTTTGGGLTGHRWAGIFVAVLILAGTLGVYLGTRRAESTAAPGAETGLRRSLRIALSHRPFRGLLLCWVVQGVGVGTMLAGVQYFSDHVVGHPSAATFLFAAFVGPAILIMPLWSRVGHRIGKRRSLIAGSLVFGGFGVLMVAAPVLPAVLIYPIAAVVGVGYAGQQVFAMAMLPDCIALSGPRQAGVFSGLWTAGETFGLALGPGLYALILQLFGYVSSHTGVAAHQDSTARLGVLLGFTVVPAVLVAGAVLLLGAYREVDR